MKLKGFGILAISIRLILWFLNRDDVLFCKVSEESTAIVNLDFALKLYAASSFETWVPIQQTTRL